MTTPAAERLYQAQHQLEMEGRKPTIYNPQNKPLEDLPVIYGFNNGGSSGWYTAVSIAEDGTCLGSHVCSHECYMEHDLGILEGTSEYRHVNDYQKHYPDGYRMEFVPSDQIRDHSALNTAFKLNREQAEKEKTEKKQEA